MGQTLSEPITVKESAACQNQLFKVGSSSMQGWRINMEDSHTHILSLPDKPDTSFFAVYDGHGGSKAAEYAGKYLHRHISKNLEVTNGDMTQAIKKGFLELDDVMKHDSEMEDESSGCTAVVVMVRDNKLYCGNLGDSRAVCSRVGVAEPLSFDHKPTNPEESRRINAAGGWVEFNRVNGNLALSRALGDFAFKRSTSLPPEQQIITAFPDVEEKEIDDDWEFIVLACDGIWDVLSNQDVVDFVRERISLSEEPEVICEDLMMRCLAPDCQMAGLGCDNMTVVLVTLLHGGDYAQLTTKCSRLVNAELPQPITTLRERRGGASRT